MSAEAQERVAAPGTLLIVAGVFQAISYLIWSFGAGLGTLTNILSNGFSAFNANDGAEMAIVAGMGIGMALIQGLEFLVDLALIPLALLAVRGGMALQQLGNPTHARTGAVTAIVSPILALLSGILSLLSFDCCGVVFGSMWALLLTVLGVVAGSLALTALGDDTVAEAMLQEV